MLTAIRIPRDAFASIVTERLRASIIDGKLKPGAQLNELKLATSFGVSRGPVREALQRLVQEGLLHSEPYRGVFVPVLTDEDVFDIYLVREALESAAIRAIIANGTAAAAAESLDQYVKLMEKAEAVGDWETVDNFDLEFHVALVDASGSPRLRRMFYTVISETRLSLVVLTAADAREDLMHKHRRICDLMQEGETEQALVVLQEALRRRRGHVVEASDTHRGDRPGGRLRRIP